MLIRFIPAIPNLLCAFLVLSISAQNRTEEEGAIKGKREQTHFLPDEVGSHGVFSPSLHTECSDNFSPPKVNPLCKKVLKSPFSKNLSLIFTPALDPFFLCSLNLCCPESCRQSKVTLQGLLSAIKGVEVVAVAYLTI